MPLDEIIGNILKAGAFLGGLAALWGVYISRRNGVKGDERAAREQEAEAKRDTVADRDQLVDQLQEEVQGYRAEAAGYRAEVAGFRTRLDRVLELYALEQEYSRTLLDWGYRGAPPPPPQRPSSTFQS